MNKRETADWERIEADYRAGVLSLREIGSEHGITEGAIRKRAKRDAWERDLGAKIQARAESLVRKAEVRAEVRKGSAVSDREIVEANATRIAQVRGEHRADITRMRRLVLDLLAELEAQTGNLDLFEDLGEIMQSLEDDRSRDKLNEIYHKVIASPTRIDGAKKLSETLKNLIGLEREAYGIGAEGGQSDAPAKKEPLTDVDLISRAARIIARRTADTA